MPRLPLRLPTRRWSRAAAALWRMAWPLVLQLQLGALLFVVDRLLVAHAHPQQLASMQLSTTLGWSAAALVGAPAVGALALVGHAVGAGRWQDATTATRAALLAGLAMGLAGAALLAVVAQPFASSCAGSDAALVSDTVAYLQIVAVALPFVGLQASAAACLHAHGDARGPASIAALGLISNLVLSAWLIAGGAGVAAMGVRGAALGSSLAVVLQASLLLVRLRQRAPAVADRRSCAFDRDTVQRSWRQLVDLSRPALAERSAFQGGYLVYAAMVALLGSGAMAANQAVVSVESFCCHAAEGIGLAAAALVAQANGARDLAQARRIVALAAGGAMALLGAAAVAFWLFPGPLLKPFGLAPADLERGRAALAWAALAQPFMAVAMVNSACLRGAGATRDALAITLTGGVAVRLTVAALALNAGAGLEGLWIASSADWATQALLSSRSMARHGLWRRPSPAPGHGARQHRDGIAGAGASVAEGEHAHLPFPAGQLDAVHADVPAGRLPVAVPRG
jgi:putative MATE family efflux protein